MSKYAYNNTLLEKTWKGNTVGSYEYYQFPSVAMVDAWSNDDDVISDISAGYLIISKTNDSSGHIDSPAEAINFLKDMDTKKTIQSAFADKGQLFFRGQGVKATITANSTESIIFTLPYNKAKLNGIEILYGEKGDTADFKVLDTVTGLYTTVPNYLLNQFGYGWNVEANSQKELLPYDADVFIGMQLCVDYTNNSSEDKLVGINFYIHEDKS